MDEIFEIATALRNLIKHTNIFKSSDFKINDLL